MMRNPFFSSFSFSLTKKTALILILTFTTIVVIDSTILKFAAYTGIQLPTSSNVGIFLTFSIIFSVMSIFFMYTTKRYQSSYTLPINIKYFRGLFFLSQIITLLILLSIFLQMTLSNKYNIYLVRAETYIAYISTLVFLILLVIIFVGWFKSKRNYLILLFAISFSLLSINTVVSLIYLDSYFSRPIKSDIQPYPITSFVTNFGGSLFSQKLSVIYDMLSVLSFSFMWIATTILLSHYRYKLGKIKYLTLVSIPLLYFLFPFEGYSGNVFFSFILDSPAIFGIIYVLTFSATKQIGALFFSIFYLISSALVAKSKVRQSILISGIGIAIIFGSLEIATLQYSVYPPFGLITAAFMPLGSYLLFIGILSSAQYISRNIEIRKELYKRANSQFDLLKTIGMAQMENEFIKRYKLVAKSTSMEKNRYNVDLEQGEIREIIHDVLNEFSNTQKWKKN